MTSARPSTDLEAGRGDHLPALSILHLPNDHTVGVTPGLPTPQFHMADNDYALGRLVEAVSHSPYWKNTAILVVEDDAQDGPDHVDAHRSPVLVISAYNRRGALVHELHNTVSLIRTMELLLGIPPMNQLDAAAVPMTIFQDTADLEPYIARLPEVALDNLVYAAPTSARERYWVGQTAHMSLTTPDAAHPRLLNEAIWFSVRGDSRPDAATAAARRLRRDARDNRRGARGGCAQAAVDGAAGARTARSRPIAGPTPPLRDFPPAQHGAFDVPDRGRHRATPVHRSHPR